MMRKFYSAVLFSLFSFLLAVAPIAAQTSATQSTAQIEQRVDSILSRMTLQQKIDMLGGVDDFYVRDFPDLNLRRLKMADGPLGVRNYGPATTMAGGISLAATWDPELAEHVGTEIGRDARARGVHFMLGPGVNIYRAPMNGRNFEYFGEDPFLASRIAVGYIEGMQSQGVSATIKHFMGNNSEFDRHNTDSIIDERTMREIYLPTFEAAVKEAHVGAIMDSYNLTNGAHMTQNGYLNTDVAKKEWRFDGIMMSDWTSTYDAIADANGGLDLEMPSGVFLNRKNLEPAIQQGKVSVATIDDKIRRILRTAVRFGWLDRDQTDYSIPRFNMHGRQVALQSAREGIVLLKNDGNLLPLDKTIIKSIAVIGPDAYPAVPVGGGSARVQPFAAVSFLEGISNFLGSNTKVLYSRGIPKLGELADATQFSTAGNNGHPGVSAEYFANKQLQGAPLVTRTEQHINLGIDSKTNFPDGTQSSRWTGYFTPQSSGPHDVFVASTGEDGGFFRLYVDDKLVFDNWASSKALVSYTTFPLEVKPHKVVLEQHGRGDWLGVRLQMGIVRQGKYVDADAKKLAANADAVVLAVGFDYASESEGADRTFGLPPGQDELIQEIAAANKNTIIVVTSGGNVETNAWLDLVPATLEAWYPGQEGGTALAEILFGDVDPSARLPVTFERRWEDNPVHDSYYPQPGTNRIVYKEGLFVGYRGYEHNGTKPLFPFGYGLSYTTFKYSNLEIKPGRASGNYQVALDVTNTGQREGAEVVQVYVSDTHAKVPRPAKELKGFSRIALHPGDTKRVTVPLDSRAFSYYDADAKQWRIDPDSFDVLVGHSSEQIELRGNITLGAGK
jgi:beta-glucosidase